MAKNTSSDTKNIAAYAKASSKLTEAELTAVSGELEASLRNAAVYFVAELKSRFDPHSKRADGHNATEAADKFARLRKEYLDKKDPEAVYSDSRIRGMFYAPSMFAKGDWHKLSHDERVRIIATGLKVVGHLIVERYRTDMRGFRRVSPNTGEQRSDARDATREPKRRIRPLREPSLDDDGPKVSPVPPEQPLNGAAKKRAATSQDLDVMVTTSGTDFGVSTSSIHTPARIKFDSQVLLTKIRRIPWGIERIGNGLESHANLSTLLDIANLPLSELSKILGAQKGNVYMFQRSLRGFRDFAGNPCGEALALLFAPLGAERGGLFLSDASVDQLYRTSVPPSVWFGGRFGEHPTMPHLPIDNGWRLLMNYNHEKMKILTEGERHLIIERFRAAGF